MKKNFKEKLISSWKAFMEDPFANSLQFISLVMIYGALYFIVATMFGIYEEPKDDVLGVYIAAYFGVMLLLGVIYIWLDNHYREWKEGKKKNAAKPSNASENRPPQNLEKSSPWKDQDDQVVVAKGKKEKSLYQRLRELPLSKDRVGQSFIIVRGGQVVKPGNGGDGGDEKDG